MPVTFTVDLEDPTETYAREGRYAVLTRRLLGLCREFNCRATFFTVGRVAESSPQLVRDIAAEGHEIAYHSHAHVSLTDEEPEHFRVQTQADKDRLEQLAGKPVIGYRAPRFSLTPDSPWAPEILAELGFKYSSSIMPTGVSLYGFGNASVKPFRWPSGLIELPLPVAQIGGTRIPYLGGIYLYTLPQAITRRWIARAASDEILWTYTHPYDFDREEKLFAEMPNTPFWISLILRIARRVAEKKIRAVLAAGAAPPLGERLNGI